MEDQTIVQQLMVLFYMFQKENGAMMTVRPKHMKHRDVMILEGIMRMHPDGSPVKMSDISEYFKVTPAAVSQVVRVFEEKGWVKRVTPAHDRRRAYIQVTDTARQYMKECMTHMQENLQMFITLLGEEDARALVRILEKAIAFYQQHHGPTTSKEEGDRTC